MRLVTNSFAPLARIFGKSEYFLYRLSLSRQLSATLSATACKHFTTVGGRHAFTESMLIYSFSVRGLKRSFHRCYNVLFVVKAYKASAKLHKTFD